MNNTFPTITRRMTQQPHTIIAASCLMAVLTATIASGEQTAAPEPAVAAQAKNAPSPGQPIDERTSADNLLRRITTQGIRLGEQPPYVLPKPTFVSIEGVSLDQATAAKALLRIAGSQGVDRFTRDSIVAPISTQIEPIKNESGERIGYFIDVAFVVHQSIADIRQSDAVKNFQSQPAESEPVESATAVVNLDDPDTLDKNQSRSLTRQELAAYNVTVDGQLEAIGFLQLPLLNQVVIRGVARARRSVWSADDDNAPVLLTWLLDSRFASPVAGASAGTNTAAIANQWRSIERSAVGEKQLGPPQPYSGMGGYIAITPLIGNPSASMVEFRFVLHEPPQWFGGSNLLRSKLPIIIQDLVRDLRRELSL